ncbi:MAG: hypothetical protein HRU19_18200 [Pseudobacteriovorax sp.]|nr:hypothetical protein [Pseudobacteriovorax sp.]
MFGKVSADRSNDADYRSLPLSHDGVSIYRFIFWDEGQAMMEALKEELLSATNSGSSVRLSF